jgi:hypothetical protein
MKHCAQLSLMSTALLAVWLTLQAQEPPTSPGPLYIEALHDHGLSTDLDDLLQYIGRLHPNHQDQQHVQQLIDQLGAEKFHDRREAMFALSEAPELTQVKLALAEVHTDQEIRRRARSLRKKKRAEGDFVLFATLRALRLHASPRSVPMLMPLIPQLNDDYLRQEAREALLASVDSTVEHELQTASDSQDVSIREVALVALGRIDSPASEPLLENCLRLANDRLALAAAEGLAWSDPGKSLPTLIRLLNSPSFSIRHQSATLLQTITSQQFGYAPYANIEQRQKARELWNNWLVADTDTHQQLIPLQQRKQRTGRILLCLFRPFTVAEIDESGNFVFESDLTRAACGGEACLTNGHRVFADWERKSLLELDAYGQLVREHKLPGIPNSLHLLDNGHMLTSLYNRNCVCEISTDGTLIWEASVDGQPSDARRLSNGNTLVAVNNRHHVLEINTDGETVWELTGDQVRCPESARRLENGNTLVACGRDGCVKEYSPRGDVVWQADKLPMAYDAIQLDNGHLLIGYQSGLRELDRGGNIIRDLKVGVVRRMHRY